MIAIISSTTRERAALVSLCASRGWVTVECDSARSAARLMQRNPPQTILVRHALSDGFSDQVLADLAATGRSFATRSIVIVTAGTSAATEARQIDLGADCVLRDPIRIDTLLAYLAKYRRDLKQAREGHRAAPASTVAFAGGTLHRAERMLEHRGRTVLLTPREIELIEHLVLSNGAIATYEALYSEILNRPFRGETSNMRVLLGKLTTSSAAIGLSARGWIEVIPKAGYRYRERRPTAARPTPPRRPTRSMA